MFDFKNAAPAELRKQYDRIAEEIGDDQFFTKDDVKRNPFSFSEPPSNNH